MKSEKKNHSSDWISEQLKQLKQSLQSRGGGPTAADKLAIELSAFYQPLSYTSEDDDMLSFVVQDALDGIDITQQYPDFYKKLQLNPDLRAAFLDTLALLEKEQANKLATPPEISSVTVETLTKSRFPNPHVESREGAGWQASWQILQDKITSIFFPDEPELAYRSSFDLVDNEKILLRSQFEAEGCQFDVLLEAVQKFESASFFHLQLLTAAETEKPAVPLFAHLTWGEFDEVVEIDETGRAKFSTVAIRSVVTEEGDGFRESLKLMLRTFS